MSVLNAVQESIQESVPRRALIALEEVILQTPDQQRAPLALAGSLACLLLLAALLAFLVHILKLQAPLIVPTALLVATL